MRGTEFIIVRYSCRERQEMDRTEMGAHETGMERSSGSLIVHRFQLIPFSCMHIPSIGVGLSVPPLNFR